MIEPICDPVIMTQHNAMDKLLQNVKLQIIKYCSAYLVIITQYNATDKHLRNF